MKKLYLIAALTAAALMSCSAVVFAQNNTRFLTGGMVSGQVIIKGQGPMIGGTVFFIDEAGGVPPSTTAYWLVPAYAYRLDATSQFSVNLPEGTYYMGAIERSSDVLAPPEEGEYFFIAQDNKGRPKKLTVWNKSSVNLGTLDFALPFKKSAQAVKGMTSIQGIIKDIHGRTVGGMLVAAFASPEMAGKPLFMAERTAVDGKYQLRLPKGGTYYLMVRAAFDAGPPSADELIGFYKNGQAVKLKTGVTKRGLDITVWPAQMFEE